jgi:hypothetical protein
MAGTLCSPWTDIDWSAVTRHGRASDESGLEDAIRDHVFAVPDRHLPGRFRLGPHTGGDNIGHVFGLDGTDERSITRGGIAARGVRRPVPPYWMDWRRQSAIISEFITNAVPNACKKFDDVAQ